VQIILNTRQHDTQSNKKVIGGDSRDNDQTNIKNKKQDKNQTYSRSEAKILHKAIIKGEKTAN
jgi:hypothetical protein